MMGEESRVHDRSTASALGLKSQTKGSPAVPRMLHPVNGRRALRVKKGEEVGARET